MPNRYNLLPLLRFHPGGIHRELAARPSRAQKYTFIRKDQMTGSKIRLQTKYLYLEVTL